jgi:2-oxoglutarate ferredoxin oxidoreductase subunit beta
VVTGLDPKIFDATTDVTWCAGCGDFGILRAVKLALADLGIGPHQALVVTGIGCGSKLPDYMTVNAFTTLHGRPLPVATGAKLANPELNVLVVNGDGDAYGIGGNHFVHTCRRNPDITQIVENNQTYGLTKGQYSPTSATGLVTTTSPDGAIERAFNPLAIALAAGATFVARTFSGQPRPMAKIIAEAVRHRGYALIDVLQPCIIYNRTNTYDWYRTRIYDLEEENHDSTDRGAASAKALEWGDRIPVGIFYRSEDGVSYEDQVRALEGGSPVGRLVDLAKDPRPEQYERLKEQFL